MEKVKVFLDTNIVLDYFTGRMEDGLAEKIVQVGKDPHFELCISFLTAVNIMYVAKKASPQLKPEVLRSIFTILPQDATQWDDAADLHMDDFEDAIQASCALRNGSFFVVSRDRHFGKAPMVYFSPDEFLAAITEN